MLSEDFEEADFLNDRDFAADVLNDAVKGPFLPRRLLVVSLEKFYEELYEHETAAGHFGQLDG